MSHQEFKNIAYMLAVSGMLSVSFSLSSSLSLSLSFTCVLFYDFWIAIVMSFQNMYGHTSLWSLWVVLLIIIWSVDGHTFTHTISEWKWKLLPVQHLLKKWTQMLLSIEFVSENEGVRAGRVDSHSHWRYCWLNDRRESKSKRPGAAGAFPTTGIGGQVWWKNMAVAW